MRSLEAKNRSIASELEQITYESNMNENRFLQKINSTEENLSQFHKEKAYQFDMIQVKHEEDLTRLKGEYELKINELVGEINHREYELKQKNEQISLLQINISELGQNC